MNVVNKILHYSFNPPEGNPTHYRSDTNYMCKDGDWFVHDGRKWTYIQKEPVEKTAIGEIEPLRVWYPKVEIKPVFEPKEVEYYIKGQRYD